MTLENCLACSTKGENSLDLRLTGAMSSNTHLQGIAAEITYDILLQVDCMESKKINSGFYRTQKGPCKVIEIDSWRFIYGPSVHIGHFTEIETILEI